MRTVLVIIACLLPVVVAGYIALPHVSERMLESDCGQPAPGKTCVTRMRSMGHVWSRKGELESAQFWYEKAAEQGDPVAMFHLAWIHEELGFAVDEEVFQEVAKLFQDDRSLEEFADVGKYRSVLQEQAATNFERAEAWYRKSAEQGFAPSMNNLGQLYAHGWGREADPEAAFRWHLAAAEAGNPIGQLNVATAYRYGHGVAANEAEAERWTAWTPAPGITADLVEPTLIRTRVARVPLPDEARAMIRHGAKLGEPMSLALKPLQADPSLRSFREVAEELPNRN